MRRLSILTGEEVKPAPADRRPSIDLENSVLDVFDRRSCMASAKNNARKPNLGEAEVRARQHQSKSTDGTVASAKKKNLGEETGVLGVREVTRYVKPPVQFMLWGIAAGRCEF